MEKYIIKGKEPTLRHIKTYMNDHPDIDYYEAREVLRELAYGGKPPSPYTSWDDYWRSF